MEKAASEIAAMLGLDVIKVDLAQREGRFGALIEMWEESRSQTARQILEDEVPRYDSQSDYTYQQVRAVMAPLGLLPDLHDMLVFDALIDNQDRHDQNWEVRPEGRLMPLFDNCTCSVPLLSIPKQRKLVGNRKRRASLYGNVRSALRWQGKHCSYDMTPLRLLREIQGQHPDDVAPSLRRVLATPLADMQSIYDEIPFPAIDEACRQLAKEALADRYDAFGELVA